MGTKFFVTLVANGLEAGKLIAMGFAILLALAIIGFSILFSE